MHAGLHLLRLHAPAVLCSLRAVLTQAHAPCGSPGMRQAGRPQRELRQDTALSALSAVRSSKSPGAAHASAAGKDKPALDTVYCECDRRQ